MRLIRYAISTSLQSTGAGPRDPASGEPHRRPTPLPQPAAESTATNRLACRLPLRLDYRLAIGVAPAPPVSHAAPVRQSGRYKMRKILYHIVIYYIFSTISSLRNGLPHRQAAGCRGRACVASWRGSRPVAAQRLSIPPDILAAIL
ncbi:MAG: hypothetical protein QY320_06380 [Gammaproteobacteria bacterium]|nr:MAG: hypothetical protein QY320_06380 [Gammaproteobacteria bacterium]